VITLLKKFANRSKVAIIAYTVFQNWRARRRFLSGKIESTSGSTHAGKTLEESLAYIDAVFDDYIKYSGISPEMIEGKRILEIGPGDNFGVALKFLSAGAAQVVCLDKFYSPHDAAQEYAIYKTLRGRLDGESGRRFDEAVDLGDGIRINGERLKVVYGKGIEDAKGLFGEASFDLILSRAVLEYLTDSDFAFSVMNDLLSPGGMMAHKIDLRDDEMFSGKGMNPLTFLTIPDSIYRLMTVGSGRCNRRLINYYRRTMNELAYDTRFFVTCVVGEKGELLPHKEKIIPTVDYSERAHSIVNEIRSRLHGDYKNLTDEDLLVSGIFLVAKKPEEANAAKEPLSSFGAMAM
jgi:SAM-dependent methyltransferase